MHFYKPMRRTFSTAKGSILSGNHPYEERNTGVGFLSLLDSLLTRFISRGSSCSLWTAAEALCTAEARCQHVCGPTLVLASAVRSRPLLAVGGSHSNGRERLIAVPTVRYASSGAAAEFKEKLLTGPGLGHFLAQRRETERGQSGTGVPLGASAEVSSSQLESGQSPDQEQFTLGLQEASKHGTIYFETFGCQMNVNDMEIVLSIMAKAGYDRRVDEPTEADVIFVNTCAIRENAESKVWHRLNFFRHLKTNWHREGFGEPGKPPPKVAVLGCMAERLKTKLIEAGKMVDVVCGPDAYRDLPRLLSQVDSGQAGVNVMLSLEETYADVSPVRIARDSPSAFVSIMRGCDNMCSYCIVPFTRGRERSRPIDSIVREVGELAQQGIREVTLLGQNVNSYCDFSAPASDCDSASNSTSTSTPTSNGTEMSNQTLTRYSETRSPLVANHTDEPSTSASALGGARPEPGTSMSEGFATIYQPRQGGARFTRLLDRLSSLFPNVRFSFTSPHPKDFPDDLIFLIRDRPNICKLIHLPAQSGSSSVLERMRRGYSREAYLALVQRIRSIIPDVAITSDFITGFCGETEEEHQETLSLLEAVGYDMAYMFAYSMRERTHAHRRMVDDVPEDVKRRRLAEMIATFRRTTLPRYTAQVGQTQLVLVERRNKRNPLQLVGKSNGGHRVIFSDTPVPDERSLLLQTKAALFPSPRTRPQWPFGTEIGDSKARLEQGDSQEGGSHDDEDRQIGSQNSRGNLCKVDDEVSLEDDRLIRHLGQGGVDQAGLVRLQIGDFVRVKIDSTSTASLFGTPIARSLLARA